jgi:type IV pilus assembly protein PilA
MLLAVFLARRGNVLEIIGMAGQCLAFFLGLVGFFESLVSRKVKKLKGLALSAVSIFIAILALGVFIIPNILSFSARAKQSEAKQELGAIYTAYWAYHLDNNTFPTAPMIQIGSTASNYLEVAGWIPHGSRYTFDCMGTPAIGPAGKHLEHCPGVVTGATKDSFTIAACGNIDNDHPIDVWTIDDSKHLRNVIDGSGAPRW